MISEFGGELPCLRALEEMVDKESAIGDIARALHSGSGPPIVMTLDRPMQEWVTAIATSAPASVKFPMIAQISLPAPILFVELPEKEGGSGIFVETTGDTVVATHVDCDDGDVWLRSLYAVYRRPAERPIFDWAEAEAKAWFRHPATEATWVQWASQHVLAQVVAGHERPDATMTAWLFKNVMIPDLLTLAAISAPSVQQIDALAREDGSVTEITQRGRA